ncbi:type 1 glutamine amidotransferase domain-containing protein [Legionella saoudiensis]|uniref:type 1 glutamine amidotransferase domain-containing protein n=1 Tax=Legionella saoudiensis TaxID=1750561 RepID=UPI00073141F4|nr:type 1 glutamine amidotransferase domain-containing protein [Legionella saoudiensis]
MAKSLHGKKIAILVANGFEQVEMVKPRDALAAAGAETHLISPEKDTVNGWDTKEWGKQFTIDIPLDVAQADTYDALLIPGGVMSPDHLRMNEKAIDFIKGIYDAQKPIAAICHGPWLLINTEIVRGKKVTSWPSLKMDLINAGGEWVDQETVVSGRILTSRNPQDIPAFNDAMIELFSQ